MQLETLQEQVDELKKNIEEQREVNKTRAQQQQATVQMLQQELDERTMEANTAAKRLDICRDVSDKLLAGIEHVFKLLKCDNSPILQLLGKVLLILGAKIQDYIK